ncbi:MAG TPA: endonuclease/exonuclease/phosphatase family protein [Phycisphaerales bacterium]|nr:endonuclease/exonuclease/phosphatase family protein [Phycisphaerales bacterium]
MLTRTTISSAACAIVSLITLAACSSPQSAASAAREKPAATRAPEILGALVTLDGDTAEWPANVTLASDEHHTYVRFNPPGEIYTLQSANKTTSILFDVDNNPATGMRPATGSDAVRALGVDLEVAFSHPRNDNNGKRVFGRGVVMFAYDAAGNRQPVNREDWDFAAAPTYASDWYEARISRTPSGPVIIPAQGLLSSGMLAGAVVTRDLDGAITTSGDIFRGKLPEHCMTGSRKSNMRVPAKADGAYRVVSYNVLRSAPEAKPEIYSRIFKALDADVYLFQEWEYSSNEALATWFNTNVGGTWHAAGLPGTVRENKGVAVVSKYPVELVTPYLKVHPDGQRDPSNVRFAGVRVDVPGPDIIASSVHLKSAGSNGSPEDLRRIAEARAIVETLDTLDNEPGTITIIGGDYNLVGSRTPLEILMTKTDTDGSDKSIADAMTLGDRTFTTWTEAGNPFGPGRLDWMVYSDSTAKATRSFVLDSSRLTDDSLQRAGLQATDTAQASDHLPVVVDLQPVR